MFCVTATPAQGTRERAVDIVVDAKDARRHPAVGLTPAVTIERVDLVALLEFTPESIDAEIRQVGHNGYAYRLAARQMQCQRQMMSIPEIELPARPCDYRNKTLLRSGIVESPKLDANLAITDCDLRRFEG